MGSASHTDKIYQLRERFRAHQQDHVFQFFDSLPSSEQVEFCEQLSKIPIDHLNEYFTEATKGKPSCCDQEIIPVFNSDLVRVGDDPESEERWGKLGMEAIKDGKVAVVTLTGGQGTRLGSALPKGCFDIGLPSHKSLFQLQAERLIRLGKMTGSPIRWYVMTSGPTHQNTVDLFEGNDYFGLEKGLVKFFEQGVLPALSLEGKILLQSKGSVALSPDGNGGIYAALRNHGIIEELESLGIQYVYMHSVDNCLVKMADPLFVGLCMERNIDCASKSVPKTNPKESVGILSRRNSDRRLLVAEYSELDPKLADAVKEDGELLFNTANIAIHLFSTEFLRKICSDPAFSLPYHVANKKIPSIDLETGEQLTTPQTGIKLEAFIFDVLELASNPIILQVDRSAEFAPLKNASGSAPEDTPESCCKRLYDLHKRWLRAANVMVAGEGPCEISPLVSYAGEGLDHLFQTVVTLPLHLQE